VIKLNAQTLLDRVQENDVVVIHDPQPLSLIEPLRKKFGNKILCVWRFHVQFDENDESSKGAWEFLRKYFELFDLFVFSTKEYLPSELKDRAVVIPPGISSLGEKNTELSLRAAVQILVSAGICPTENGEQPVEPPFKHQAKRLCPDEKWRIPAETKFSLLTHPVITQISRWDPLKGWVQLLKSFQIMKEEAEKFDDGERKKKIRACKLVLGGPDPEFVKDDPEGKKILNEIKEVYMGLSDDLKKDVAIINLPMNSVAENALMVNAIQRASSIVVQNSLKEGFGLTVSEAMWKKVPVVVSGYCPGLCAQVRDGVDGRWILGPESGPYDEKKYMKELVKIMSELICDDVMRNKMGVNAQRRIQEEFLTYNPLSKWIETLGKLIAKKEEAQHS
jgi:trehalose synthase